MVNDCDLKLAVWVFPPLMAWCSMGCVAFLLRWLFAIDVNRWPATYIAFEEDSLINVGVSVCVIAQLYSRHDVITNTL